MKLLVSVKQLFNSWTESRFSTYELEHCTLRNGLKFEINYLFFDDWERNYPSRITGKIMVAQGSKKGTWDQFGRCVVSGQRRKEYDIVRPHTIQQEIHSMRYLTIALIVLVLIFAILILIL